MEKIVWRVVLLEDNEEFSTRRITTPEIAEEYRKALSDLFPFMKVAIIGQVEEVEPPARSSRYEDVLSKHGIISNVHYEDLLSEQVRLSNKKGKRA